MNYTINSDVLEKYNLTMEEYLVLLLNAKGAKYSDLLESVIAKKLADRSLYDNNELVLSNNTKDLISNILVESDKRVINKEIEYSSIADRLREIFPKGKKSGTNYMWRDSTAVIARKLKTLVTQFNFTFTEEQAIKATERYVKSFQGDYTYMQLLKYFIFKTDRSGEVKSDFMSLIQNDGQEDSDSVEYWTERLT